MDTPRGCPRTCGDLAAAGCVVLLVLLVAGSSPPVTVPPIRTAVALRSAASPELDIDPSSWWMLSGNATSFRASWVDPAPGCGISPAWFRWSITGATAEGSLNSTTGLNISFAASSVLTGTTTLRVRSAVMITCGTAASVLVAGAEANVTVVAPIALENLSLSPDPVAAGGTAFLHGNLSGGEPPYTLQISWGGGNVSALPIPTPGTFSIPHTFPAGSYLPTVVVTDSAGLAAQAAVGEVLAASDSLAVGITAVNTETDVDIPVPFNATALDEPVGSAAGWSCGPPGTFVPVDRTSSTDFSCAFSAVGTGDVLFEVLPPPSAAPASVTLRETVVPRPTIVALSPNLTGEVGEPGVVTVAIAGGVPPFHLDWVDIGTTTSGALVVPADGPVVLPFTPVRSGSLELVARAIDADGVVTLNATTRWIVEPALNTSAVPSRISEPWGAELSLTGSVTAGVAPFLWLVTTGSVPLNETDSSGVLSAVGSFGWEGSYAIEGSTAVTLTLVDGVGGFSTRTFEIAGVPPLAGRVSVVPAAVGSTGTFLVALSLSGGLPPFELNVSASDGTSANRTVPSDGTSWSAFTAERGGALRIRVSVTDRLGVECEWNRTVAVPYVSPPPVPPTGENGAPSPLGTSLTTISVAVLVALVVVGGAVLGISVLRRRRAHGAPAPPPDPVAVLRQIIEPADGADRTTVELLAEEAGVALDVARSTLDRLIAAGAVRSETEPEGEEVLSWSSPQSP
jgi:hypothetical protein